MTDATDFLQGWIAKAKVRAPSITRTGAQRWPVAGPPPDFKPGLASYGWGINGSLVQDATGQDNGLRFAVDVWFSDRGQDVGNPPPNSGAQFKADASDKELLTFTLADEAVRLDVELVTWGSAYTVFTTQVDSTSGQLVFSGVPAAGPVPVHSLLIVSFADTGTFGWL